MKKKNKPHKQYVSFLLAGIGICLATIYLFYDFEPLSFLIFVGVPFIMKYFNKKAEEKRKWNMNVAFLDGLQFMKNSLAAGYSAEGSVREARKGLEKLYGSEATITGEFITMQAQISMGITLEEALKGFADRSDIEDIKNFSEVFSLLKRTGGDLNRVIKQTTSNLKDKIELKRDLNIVVAEKLGEFRIMCLIPYGILAYLKVCSPSMTESLYHSLFGGIFMTIVLIAYVVLVGTGEWILNSRMKE